MIRWIQWKYVAPRLAVLAGVWLIVWIFFDPLLRWSLVSTGQSITGAKVDIGRLDTSIVGGRLCLQDIEIANPDSPQENLIEAREAEFELDQGALLKRQFVVREGRLSGIKLNTARRTSGKLNDAQKDALENQSKPTTASAAGRWLKQFSSIVIDRQIEQELELVKVSSALLARWPEEYNKLSRRADAIYRRAETLRKQLEDSQLNPLKDADKIQRAIEESRQLRQDIAQLRADIDRLRQHVPRAYEELLAAKQRDVQRIGQMTQLASLDGDAWTEYLLGPEYGKQVDDVIAWIQWGRKYIAGNRNVGKPSRSRGYFVPFRASRKTPNFLVQNLSIDGEGDVNGQPLSFSGTARGLTTQPRVFGKPAVFELQTAGAAKLIVHAVIDRTRKTPTDRIRIECPSLPQPERILGNRDQLALHVAASNLQLRIDLNLRGSSLAGKLRLTQPAVQFEPHVSENYGGEHLSGALRDSINDVDKIEILVDLAGTIKQPTWKIHCDLGPRLAKGFNNVFQRELVARRQQLATGIDRYFRDQSAHLNQIISKNEQTILEKLSIGDNQLAQLKDRAASRLGFPARTDFFNERTGGLSDRIGDRPGLRDLFQSPSR